MACASHLGDCELYGRRLERGLCSARCGLCAVAAIDMALPQTKAKGSFWQSSGYVLIQCHTWLQLDFQQSWRLRIYMVVLSSIT